LFIVVDSPDQVFVGFVVRVNIIVRARDPMIIQCSIHRSKAPFFVRMPMTHLESSESYISVRALGFLGDSALGCIQHGLADAGVFHHVRHFVISFSVPNGMTIESAVVTFMGRPDGHSRFGRNRGCQWTDRVAMIPPPLNLSLPRAGT
jgi:hypothetical protein